MTELLLILFGGTAVRRRWWMVALAGAAWLLLGAFFFINAFTEEHRIRGVYFAIPLLVDGALSLLSAIGRPGASRSLRLAKAAVFLTIALLIVVTAGRGEFIIGLIAGTFLIVDAGWRATSAYLVRFFGWRRAIVFSAVEFVLGVWSFLPWPTYWQGEVGGIVGLLLMVSASRVCLMAWRLARLRPGMPVSRQAARWMQDAGPGTAATGTGEPARGAEAARIAATVHVWTPTGSLSSLDHTISRYVAARDENGVISTGHAAMQGAGFYISHYPAVEIDRDSADFQRALRATQDNDVPGKFQPSYEEESAGWCPSSMQVLIDGIDGEALARFWRNYSADKTYNLTNRNCSSTVATALDAGLDGVFAPYISSPYFLLRLLMSPELWIAAELRARARAMAWTPGIVLDYARALSYILALPGRLRVGK